MSLRLGCILLSQGVFKGVRYSSSKSFGRPVLFHLFYKHQTIWRSYSKWDPNIVKSPIPDIPIPETSFSEFVWSKNDRWANRTAMVCAVSKQEITFAELRDQCKRFGVALLTQCGLEHGKVIATVLPNTVDYPPILFGAIEAGIVASPVNPNYMSSEIAHQLKDSGAELVVTCPEKLNDVKAAIEQLGTNVKIIVTGKDAHDGTMSFEKLLSESDPSLMNELKPKKISTDDVIILPYSSGTTGVPKGVCLTHKNLLSNMIAMQAVGEVQEAQGKHQDVIPQVLPIFHIYGFTIILSQGISTGSKLIMLPRFDPKTFLWSLKDQKASVLYVAPPLVLFLGNSKDVTEDYLKTVRSILNGAAPVGELDINKCLEKSPPTTSYKQGYGLTETAPAVCSIMKGANSNYSSVGPPVVNTLVKVIDIQTGQSLGNNEEGEICCKGPQVMKGYWNKIEETKKVIDDDGWFHTGDIGYYDSDGYFYITDRLKELIKVKGFQVAPAELESFLRSHPDIEDAGVIGIPHKEHGEVPIGFIQIKNGIKPDLNSIENYLKGKVAKYKQIKEFIILDKIPKSASGKILRKDLRVMYNTGINKK